MPREYSFAITKHMKTSFWIFLISQSISNLGDTFQFLATTILLYKITGSGLSAGFGLVISPIPSIVLSAFAGVIGDILPEKYFLSILNILRGSVVILFIGNSNKWSIFLLIFILSVLNVLGNPPGKKIIVKLLKGEEILVGNSVMTGVSGIINLLGPFIAGALIDFASLDFTYTIGIILFFISSVIMLFIRVDNGMDRDTRYFPVKLKWSYIYDLKKGLSYYKRNTQIREIISIGLVVSFVSAAVNFAFYPFALEVLNVTGKGFGFMISIFYGSNILAMGILILFHKQITSNTKLFIFMPLTIVACTWMLYGLARNLGIILITQIIEGTAAALFATVFTTKLQTITQKQFLARIVGISDLIGNLGKVLGIGSAYIIIKFYTLGLLFEVFSFFLFVYAAFKLFDLNSALIDGSKLYGDRKE